MNEAGMRLGLERLWPRDAVAAAAEGAGAGVGLGVEAGGGAVGTASARTWPWAGRVAGMRGSAVRELLRVTAQPDMISLAGGLPAVDLFPTERLRQAVEAVLARRPAAALQYGETEGVGELRDWIAERASVPGCRWTRENVLITSGAQQGLDLFGRVLLDAGDGVRVPNPTYLALLSAWRPLGVRFLPWADGGARGVHGTAATGPDGPAKAWYVVPNFANPTGQTLDLAGRGEVVLASAREGSVVLEDDPYGDLRYEGEALPGLLELASMEGLGRCGGARVLRSGSFSKVLAPGLRVGWLLGPSEAIRQLALAKQSMDLHTSALGQQVILELVRAGAMEVQRPVWVAAYRERRDAMLAALAEHLPSGVRWTRPDGGMFVWVTLPAAWDAGALIGPALGAGVAFVPGGEFHLGAAEGEGRHTLRLNFTHADPGRLREGVARLGRVMREVWGVDGGGEVLR